MNAEPMVLDLFAPVSLVPLAVLLTAGLSAFLALNVNLQRLVYSNDALIPVQEDLEVMTPSERPHVPCVPSPCGPNALCR